MVTSAPPRLLRAAAIACSLGLAGFVIVNAQFGCDSSTTTPPPAEPVKDATPAPNAAPVVEPSPQPVPAPAASSATQAEPTQANPAPEPAQPTAEPVFMPASKSGGDFGSMRFPGEGAKEPAEAPQNQEKPSK